jgi:hypothetical protein
MKLITAFTVISAFTIISCNQVITNNSKNIENDPSNPNIPGNPGPIDTSLTGTYWETSLGNSESAVTDGGVFITRWCNWAQTLSIVSGPSLALPAPGNVLRMHSNGGCGHVERENAYPEPYAGLRVGVRYYIANGTGQTDSKMHPFCFSPVGAIQGVHMAIGTWDSGPLLGGRWIPHFRLAGEPQDSFGFWARSPNGSKIVIEPDTWLRYEFIMHFLSPTTYRFYPRLYDANGNLLAGENDWRSADVDRRLLDWYNQSPNNVFTFNNIQTARILSWGMGQAGGSGGYYYIGAPAWGVRSSNDDFIGTDSIP